MRPPTINRPPSRLQASSQAKIKAEPQPTKRSLGRPEKPETPDTGKATEVAMNTPAKETTKPATPATDKGQDNPDPFGANYRRQA